jgi:proline racemase
MKFKNLITVIDSHTEGQPTCMVVSGYPKIPGRTMMEKRDYVRENLDHLRTALVYEPRGVNNAFACLMTPPVSDEADFGIIWMQGGLNKEHRYLTMCGHGTIGVATCAVETGIVESREPVTEIKIDTPAGLVSARVNVSGGKARSVTIQNVPSFYYKTARINVSGIGDISVDLAYGGNNYAIINAAELHMTPTMNEIRQSRELLTHVLDAVNTQSPVQHPEKPSINQVLAVLLNAKPVSPQATVKNVYVDENNRVDRSPCGTGSSARMAVCFGKGELKIGEQYITESITDTLYVGKLVKEVKVGSYRAAIPEITGRAFVTGINQFVIDEDDPFKYGFVL